MSNPTNPNVKQSTQTSDENTANVETSPQSAKITSDDVKTTRNGGEMARGGVETSRNVENTENPARVGMAGNAMRIPSHGKGRLAPLIQPGQAFNPGGRPRTLKDVRQLARKQSKDALHALIGCYMTPEGKIARNVDGRVVVAAASTVLEWAFGKPPPFDPNSERPEERIDISGMTLEDRRALLEVMQRVTTTTAPGASSDDDAGSDFDASRFEQAPLEIEGEVIDAGRPAIAAIKPPRAAPKISAQGSPKASPERGEAVPSARIMPTVAPLEPANRAEGRLGASESTPAPRIGLFEDD